MCPCVRASFLRRSSSCWLSVRMEGTIPSGKWFSPAAAAVLDGRTRSFSQVSCLTVREITKCSSKVHTHTTRLGLLPTFHWPLTFRGDHHLESPPLVPSADVDAPPPNSSTIIGKLIGKSVGLKFGNVLRCSHRFFWKIMEVYHMNKTTGTYNVNMWGMWAWRTKTSSNAKEIFI